MDMELEKISNDAVVKAVVQNCFVGVVCRKSELDKKFSEDGDTALHFAASYSVVVVKELLAVDGSNPYLIQGEDGIQPMHHVTLKGKFEVLQELLDAYEVSARRKTCLILMETILHHAVSANCYDVLKFSIEMINFDAKFLNAKNVRANTILHLAVAWKQLQTVKFLVNQKGIDVHAINKKSLILPDLHKESLLQTGDDKIRAVLLEVDRTTTLSYSTISPAQEKTAFAAHEIDSQVDKTDAPFEHHSTLHYILFRNEFKAAPFMSSTTPLVAGKYDTDINLVMNVMLIASATYLNIISIPLFCSEPFEESRMIFALITCLGSIIILTFSVIRIKVAPIKIIALSMLFGTLIAMLHILSEHDRGTLTIFITANFQLALCVQQLKKIEKTARQATSLSTNTKALQIARTAKFLTLAFISFAVASYYCVMVYKTTLSFTKDVTEYYGTSLNVGSHEYC